MLTLMLTSVVLPVDNPGSFFFFCMKSLCAAQTPPRNGPGDAVSCLLLSWGRQDGVVSQRPRRGASVSPPANTKRS